MTSDWQDIVGAALTGIGWAALPLTLLPVIYLFVPRHKTFKSICNGFIEIIDGFNYYVGEIVKWALPILVLSVAFSVFALSIFGYSSTKLSESAEYLHATVIMLGAAATLLAGQHVRVDVFHANMSPTSKAFVDFCGYYVLLLPVGLILLWGSQSFVAFSWQIFEGSPESDGIRGEFLLKTLIPIFAIMMIAQGLSIALRAAMCMRGESRPSLPEHISPLYDTQPATDTHSEYGL